MVGDPGIALVVVTYGGGRMLVSEIRKYNGGKGSTLISLQCNLDPWLGISMYLVS